MNNVLILGELNSGKCTLHNQIISTFGNRFNLNFFKIINSNFNLLRVPCFVDYLENFDNGMALADIILVLINEDSKDIEFTINQILYSLSLGHKNYIFLINKIDLTNDKHQTFKDIKSSFLNKLQSMKIRIIEDNINYIEKNWSCISAKEAYNFTCETLLEKVCFPLDSLLIHSYKEFPNDNKLRFSILDKFIDEEGILNASGKILSGVLNNNFKYFILPMKISIECISIKNVNDKLLDSSSNYNFVTIKAKIIDTEKIDSISRGNIITSSIDMPVFNVFEAEIETFDLNQKIVTKGFECLMKLNCITEEVIVEKILDSMNFIKSFSIVKMVLKLKNNVCAEKYETFPSLSHFALLSENKLIGTGKILRYKKLN